MVIVQVDDLAAEAARLEPAGIRKVFEIDNSQAKTVHMHPRDVPGVIPSMDQMVPPEAWYWAGSDWETRAARHVSAITGVQIQCVDPEGTAEKWSRAYNREIIVCEGVPTLRYEQGEVRFVADADGRGDGLQMVDMRTSAMEAIEAAAQRLGLPFEDSCVSVCGTVFNFTE